MFSRKQNLGIFTAIFFALICLMPAFAEQALEAPEPVLDQRALDELKIMTDTLAQASSVQFKSQSMVPLQSPSGLWINLYGTSQVVKHGRDKLFISTAGDFSPHDFYFDGKKMTAYVPSENLYAEMPAPASVDALIEQAYTQQGSSFPFADVLITESYAVLTDQLTQAFYVGQSTLNGVKTNHLAFANQGVEWQIWIGVDDHLPRLVAANYLDQVGEPTYTVEFEDWKLNEPVDAKIFEFKNTTQAGKTEFGNLNQGVQS